MNSLARQWCSFSLTVLATLLSGCDKQVATTGLIAGRVFPEVELSGLGGGSLALGELKGKVILLNVWAPWCAPCVEEMPSLERLSQRLDSERYAVIGLAPGDDRYLLEEFIQRNQISFPNFVGEEALIESELHVQGYPMTFVIGADYELQSTVIGSRAWDEERVVDYLHELYADTSSKSYIGLIE